MMGGLVPAPVHYISGKCPHLAINVLSSPFSKCFFYRRRVLQQCLRAFVHKISFAQFFHQFLILQVRPFLVPESWHADVEGGIWTRPYDWQWYGGPLDDFDDDCYSKASNCYCRHCLWKLRRRSLSTWRSQSTCRTSFRPSSPRLTTSSWTKRWKESRNDVEPVDEVSKEIYIRWRTSTSCTVNSRRRARTNIQRFRRWRDQRYRKTLNMFCFSGETWINLVSSCIFWGALAEVSGRAVHSQRGELTSDLWLHEAFHPNQAFSPAAAYNQFDLETADSE